MNTFSVKCGQTGGDCFKCRFPCDDNDDYALRQSLNNSPAETVQEAELPDNQELY